MTIKEITLHLDENPATERRLEGAITLAEAFGAHLVGIAAEVPPTMPGYLAVDAGAQLLDRWIADVRRRIAETREMFEARVAESDVQAEFRVRQGSHLEAMLPTRRTGDLVIVAQDDPDAPSMTDGLADELVMAAGRPVLVWPYVGAFPTPGRTVLVAWNGTREATRALHDSMPFLEAAAKVYVTSIAASSDETAMAEGLAQALVRRGVTAEARGIVARDFETPELLLSAVAEVRADLIVMGAWGHSRLREMMLGGATREILEAMTAPTLLSH